MVNFSLSEFVTYANGLTHHNHQSFNNIITNNTMPTMPSLTSFLPPIQSINTINSMHNNLMKYECDSKGYISFIPGLIIDNKYKMIRQLGKGTFSRVFECIQLNNGIHQIDDNKKYAVKIIRNVYKYQFAARMELSILRKIKNEDPNNTSNCIHIIDYLNFNGHPIFVFPLLGQSIYSFMKNNGHKPFCYNNAIDLIWQILNGVNFIHSLNIIIADIKPENIIFVNDGDQSNNMKIKLIDFGSAIVHSPSNAMHSHLVQTRHYRAPEVIFKLDWSFSVDMWSIGCILIELIYGKMLFNTHCNIDHLNQMVKCIGIPPSNLLQLIDDNTWNNLFDHQCALNIHKAKISPIQCVKLHDYFVNDIHLNQDCANLYDLCKRLLCWDPNQRMTARQALLHPIFSKYHKKLNIDI